MTEYLFLGHDPWYERSKSGTTQTTTDYIYVNGGLEFIDDVWRTRAGNRGYVQCEQSCPDR